MNIFGKWTTPALAIPLATSLITASLLTTVLLTAFWPTPAAAQGGPFSKGTVRLSGSASARSGFGGGEFQLGVGLGYYPMDGLELGLDARTWLGSDYSVHELEPSATYVFAVSDQFTPYVGVLYRRTFLDGRDDLTAYGARVGVYLQQTRNMHIRAGVAGIWYQDCDATFITNCSQYYPEVTVGFSF